MPLKMVRPNEIEIDIFSESKRVLSYGGLTTDVTLQIGDKSIPRIFVRYVHHLLQGISLVAHTYLCLKNGVNNFGAIILPFGAAITSLSVVCTYVSLVFGAREIDRLWIYVQQLVDESKYFRKIRSSDPVHILKSGANFVFLQIFSLLSCFF